MGDQSYKLGLFINITFFCIIFNLQPVYASSGKEKAKEEIQDSLNKIRANIEKINKNLVSLKNNVLSGQKNITNLQQDLDAKKKSYDETLNNLKHAENSLDEAKKSESDFQKGLLKDIELSETTRKDIDITKKRLSQLQENVKILQENIDIDKENIKKVGQARAFWEKSTKSYKDVSLDLKQSISEMDVQISEQHDHLKRNQSEVEKWEKQLKNQTEDLEHLENDISQK